MNIRSNSSGLWLLLVWLMITARFSGGANEVRPGNLENQIPTITWSGVTNQVLQRGQSVDLRVLADDPDGSISHVEYRANGALLVAMPPASLPPPIPGSRESQFPYPFFPSEPGVYRVTAVAVDTLGATNATPEVVVRLNALPQITLGQPESGNWTSPVDFRLPVDVVDPDGTVAEVVLEYAYADSGSFRGLATNTQAPFDFEIRGFIGSPGVLRVSAWDDTRAVTRRTIGLPFLRPPPGDDPLNPIRLVSDVTGLKVDFRKVTSDPGEFSLARLPSISIAASYSFVWTAPTNRLVRVDTFGSTFDTALQVNRVEPGRPPIIVVRSQDDSFRSPWSQVRFEALSGQTFQIFALGYTNRDLGTLVFNFQTTDFTPPPPAAPPANDQFANAEELVANAPPVAGTTRGATGDLPVREVPFGGTNSVWYRWTAPTNGVAEVVTTEVTGDTVLSVFTLSPWVVRGQSDDRSPTDFSSRLLFRAQAGQVYHIQVGANAPTQGDFRIQLRFPADDVFANPPVNDAFGSATPVEGLFVTVPGTLVGATAEWVEGRPEVWWRWTSPVDGPVHAALVPWATVAIPPRLRVLRGTSLETLVPAPNALPNFLTSESISPRRFLATAGETYYLVVDALMPADFFVTLNAEMALPLQALVVAPESGPRTLRIQASRAQRVAVERSTDLRQWTTGELRDVPAGFSEVPIPAPEGPESAAEFYRVVRP